jgi:hypothetical protein
LAERSFAFQRKQIIRGTFPMLPEKCIRIGTSALSQNRAAHLAALRGGKTVLNANTLASRELQPNFDWRKF